MNIIETIKKYFQNKPETNYTKKVQNKPEKIYTGKVLYRPENKTTSNQYIPRKIKTENKIEPDKILTIEVLKILEWKRFETLCCDFLNSNGFKAYETKYGPDGGVDIAIYDQNNQPCGIVQCKAWNKIKVGEKEIREFLGIMAKEGHKQGMFITTGEYTNNAIEFAKGTNIKLVTGQMLVDKINNMPKDKSIPLLQKILDGDYWTPTCSRCGIKMIKRESKKEKNEGQIFWGCKNYPRCKQTLAYKNQDVM